MVRRWAKLEKDFLSKTGVFDISKIPDIYDCIKYDLLHNITILQLEQAEEIYTYAKNLADVVIPQVIIIILNNLHNLVENPAWRCQQQIF